MAERNSLLNCRTGNGTEGSNPSLSANKPPDSQAVRKSPDRFRTIMQKYKLLKAYDAGGDINKEWFVYYHYLKPKEFQRPNEPLYERFKVGKTINCIHTVKERKQQLKVVYLAVKNMLEEGFNPFAEYWVQDHVEYAGYNICSCIDKYLASIDGDLKPHTIRIYKSRLGYLMLWLESKGYDNC